MESRAAVRNAAVGVPLITAEQEELVRALLRGQILTRLRSREEVIEMPKSSKGTAKKSGAKGGA